MSNRKSSWKSKNRKNNEPPVPKPPDTSAKIGFTDLTNKDVQIYLVKMPTFLAEQFENKQNVPNKTMGRLRIPHFNELGVQSEEEEEDSTKIKREKPRIFLDKVEMTGSVPKEGVPTEYEMEFQHENPKVMVFSGSRNAGDVAMQMEGKVSFQCLARPKLDNKYRNVNKRRTMMATETTRETLLMDDSSRKAVDRDALKPMSMTETAKQREERKKSKEDARRHLDIPDEAWKEMAKIAVFKAFEIQAHYSADELAKVLGEPIARLRPIITEVCSYNKVGPFSGKHELKDELKTVAQRQQKERELEDHRLAQIEAARKRREERAEREKLEGPSTKKSRLS